MNIRILKTIFDDTDQPGIKPILAKPGDVFKVKNFLEFDGLYQMMEVLRKDAKTNEDTFFVVGLGEEYEVI